MILLIDCLSSFLCEYTANSKKKASLITSLTYYLLLHLLIINKTLNVAT